LDRAEIEWITDYIFVEDEDKTADIAIVFGTRTTGTCLREAGRKYSENWRK